MAALELTPGAAFDPIAFDQFLDAQSDLGTKWRPAFVRVTGELPKLASMKVDPQRLRREAWQKDEVFWSAGRGEALQGMRASDRLHLDSLLAGTRGRPGSLSEIEFETN
jgi:fatty-acyl-CoA synthase